MRVQDHSSHHIIKEVGGGVENLSREVEERKRDIGRDGERENEPEK